MFSASDDNAMMKQIQSTHAPDGRIVDVKPILQIIENVLRHVTPNIDHALNGGHGHVESFDDRTSLAATDGMLDALAYIVQKISCEILCKCSRGGDAHSTTMALLNMLSIYSWDAKMVLTLAAFAVNIGEFWLIVQLCTANSVAKSVALLKQLPDILEHSNTLRPQFDALNNLIRAMMDVTKCIVEFTEIPPQYILSDVPPMSIAMAHIPTASYWTIRSVVSCASQMASLVGLGHEYVASTSEAWELSSLAHRVSSIHDHLQKILRLCYQHIDEKRQAEDYKALKHSLETPQPDNLKILIKIFSLRKEEPRDVLLGPDKTKVHMGVLRRKHLLLLISDLDISHDEIQVLEVRYKYERSSEHNYEVIWLPIVNGSTWNDAYQQKFLTLKSIMPWYTLMPWDTIKHWYTLMPWDTVMPPYTVTKPSIIEPAIIEYSKEVWRVAKKPIVVTLDPLRKVTCRNALNMLRIWGNAAFPFSSDKEESLWKEESWTIELLVDGLEANLINWMKQDKLICLYGGEDFEWIQSFTSATKNVIQNLGIGLEMVYVGKNNAKERVRKISTLINERQISHTWPETAVWFFWNRLESMLFSKSQHSKNNENDVIKLEVMTLLGYDGSEHGWAVFFHGPTEMVRAKGDKALGSMQSFEKWEDLARQLGFIPALRKHLEGIMDEHHCTRLILPGISGGIAASVVCAECRRPMEMYFMYRCCVD